MCFKRATAAAFTPIVARFVRPECVSCVQQPPRLRPLLRVSCVQRAPRRGNKPPAQGKRAQRATPWVRPVDFRYAPTGQKQRQEGLMAVPENAYSLHITHHAAINALLSLLLPRWGVSAPIVRNPGCRIASLACPELGARYPFGVPVERMVSANPYRSSSVARMVSANPYRSSPVERMACAVPFPRNAHETRASRVPSACKIF